MANAGKQPGAEQSLYDQLYARHLDCADHLCNEESSGVDSSSSADFEYESAVSNDATEASPSAGSEKVTPRKLSDPAMRRKDSEAAPKGKEPVGTRGPPGPAEPWKTSEDEAESDSDVFAGYTDEKTKKKDLWGKTVLGAFNIYARVTGAADPHKKLLAKRDSEADALENLWDDFGPAQGGPGGQDSTVKGVVDSRDGAHVALQKRGFYTVFLRTARAAEKKKHDLYAFKVKFSYKVFYCRRKKDALSAVAGGTSSSKDGNTFVAHYAFGEDSVSFLNEGHLTLSGNSTKILLLYAMEDSVAEFSIACNVLDSHPEVLYKISYCDWCLAVPLSLSPNLRLRILSIDSCDNLGTTALSAFYAIEQRISAITGGNAKIGDYFDMICGSGSGALLALCLLKGYSARELWLQWQSILARLFKWPHSVAYGLIFDHTHVNEFVRAWIEILGTDFMQAKGRPLCALISANVKQQDHSLFVFRNYTNVHAAYGGTTLAPMWLAGWASTALPTYVKGPTDSYFKSIGCRLDREAHLVDGKLISTNPSLIALREASDLYGFPLRTLVDDIIELFLSVGTSRAPQAPAAAAEDPSAWQLLLNSNVACATRVEDAHMQHLFEEHRQRYRRIELPRVRGCKYGKTDKATVDATFGLAAETLRKHLQGTVDEIAKAACT